MSAEVISILVLAGIFLLATVRPINLGALAIVSAFVVGVWALDGADIEERTDAVFAGFPGELFIILVGVTFLFAIAKQNGTVDWLVQAAIRGAGGRIGVIPWILFLITAALTATGAVVPASVAILAPVGAAFALRYRIEPMLMGVMIISGATAGGFSPMSVFGGITNGVVEKAGLPSDPAKLFLVSFVANLLLALVAFLRWGGLELLRRRAEPAVMDSAGAAEPTPTGPFGGGGATAPAAAPVTTGAAGTEAGPVTAATKAPAPQGPITAAAAPAGAALTLDRDRVLTLIGLAGLAVGALFFDLNVGLLAITVATILTLLTPALSKSAVEAIAWPTVLLVCGIVLYVGVMEEIGTIKWLGDEVADIGTPLAAALVICFIGAVVSAFASTTGILGALIPLAVPFLSGNESVGAVGVIIALAISSSVVDASPFSTSGALVVANAPEQERDAVYKGLIKWGFSMVVLAPIATWTVLVVPGWLG